MEVELWFNTEMWAQSTHDESRAWRAECLEYDLAAEGRTCGEAYDRLREIISAHALMSLQRFRRDLTGIAANGLRKG